jgi:hypothetical protein
VFKDAPFHGSTAVPMTLLAAVSDIGGGGHKGLQGPQIKVCGVSMGEWMRLFMVVPMAPLLPGVVDTGQK